MDYSRSHWLELIDRYQPDILWSDIGYPADSRLEDLFRYYYDKVPEGLVNDRWSQFPNWLRNPWGKSCLIGLQQNGWQPAEILMLNIMIIVP